MCWSSGAVGRAVFICPYLAFCQTWSSPPQGQWNPQSHGLGSGWAGSPVQLPVHGMAGSQGSPGNLGLNFGNPQGQYGVRSSGLGTANGLNQGMGIWASQPMGSLGLQQSASGSPFAAQQHQQYHEQSHQNLQQHQPQQQHLQYQQQYQYNHHQQQQIAGQPGDTQPGGIPSGRPFPSIGVQLQGSPAAPVWQGVTGVESTVHHGELPAAFNRGSENMPSAPPDISKNYKLGDDSLHSARTMHKSADEIACEALNSLAASLTRSGSLEEARSVLTLTLPLQNCETLRLAVVNDLRSQMGKPLLTAADTHVWLRNGASDFAVSQWWSGKPSEENSSGGLGFLKAMAFILILGSIGIFVMQKSTEANPLRERYCSYLGSSSPTEADPLSSFVRAFGNEEDLREDSNSGNQHVEANGGSQENRFASEQVSSISVSTEIARLEARAKLVCNDGKEQPERCGEENVEKPPESEHPDRGSPELAPVEVVSPSVTLSLSQALGLESLPLLSSDCPTWSSEHPPAHAKTGETEHRKPEEGMYPEYDGNHEMDHGCDHDVIRDSQLEMDRGRAESDQQETHEDFDVFALVGGMAEVKEVSQSEWLKRQVEKAAEDDGAASRIGQDPKILEAASEDCIYTIPPRVVQPPASMQSKRGPQQEGKFVPNFLQGHMARIRGTTADPTTGAEQGKAFPSDPEHAIGGNHTLATGAANDHNEDDEIIIQEMVDEEDQIDEVCLHEDADDRAICSLATLEEEQEEQEEEVTTEKEQAKDEEEEKEEEKGEEKEKEEEDEEVENGEEEPEEEKEKEEEDEEVENGEEEPEEEDSIEAPFSEDAADLSVVYATGVPLSLDEMIDDWEPVPSIDRSRYNRHRRQQPGHQQPQPLQQESLQQRERQQQQEQQQEQQPQQQRNAQAQPSTSSSVRFKLSRRDREIFKQRKKLRDIEDLEQAVAKGAELAGNQKVKISLKQEVLIELARLEDAEDDDEDGETGCSDYVEVTPTRFRPNGCTVKLFDGSESFLPAEQIDPPVAADTNEIRARLREVATAKGLIRVRLAGEGTVSMLSPRSASTREEEFNVRRKAAEAKLNALRESKLDVHHWFKGRVTSVQPHGIFVSLVEGKDAYVPIAEMPPQLQGAPKPNLKSGEEVSFRLIRYNRDRDGFVASLLTYEDSIAQRKSYKASTETSEKSETGKDSGSRGANSNTAPKRTHRGMGEVSVNDSNNGPGDSGTTDSILRYSVEKALEAPLKAAQEATSGAAKEHAEQATEAESAQAASQSTELTGSAKRAAAKGFSVVDSKMAAELNQWLKTKPEDPKAKRSTSESAPPAKANEKVYVVNLLRGMAGKVIGNMNVPTKLSEKDIKQMTEELVRKEGGMDGASRQIKTIQIVKNVINVQI